MASTTVDGTVSIPGVLFKMEMHSSNYSIDYRTAYSTLLTVWGSMSFRRL